MHPGADHRGLVADRVDAVEQVGPRRGVADVELVGAVGRRRTRRAPRQHQVDADHLVAVGLEGRADAVPMKPAEPVSRTLTGPS